MTIVRRVVLVCLFLPLVAFAQSADQEVVSAVDAPDPVAPGATLTYTVTLTNNGPDPAVNGGININLPLAVTHQSSVAPAGFSCLYLGNNGTCSTPSLAVGTYVFTINVLVSASLANFPDQSISATFFPSGTTIDPNSANNSKTATTLVDSPQVDLSLTVTDSPDPVFPDGTITYTVPVTNGGPDTATSVNFNVVPNSSLAFQSVTVPTGWSCAPPPVGSLNATFSCSRATWAPGTDNFTVVFSANDENIGINDTTINSFFGVNAGGSNETDTSDNGETESTQYTTPDADMAVSVTDSPDPVGPDGDITYTVTVQNNGPDAAPNAQMSVFNNNSLRFQSATVPAGWNCTLPAVDAAPVFSCTNPSFANGGSSVFTVVLRAYDEVLGINDGTVSTNFSVSSAVSDPNNGNNSETEDTSYVTPDADISVTDSDSPDPVAPGGTITYTQSITNGGPDAAPSVSFSQSTPTGTTFQSLSAPAGWSCATPAVGGTGSINCTKSSMAAAETGAFTLVVNVTGSGTITSAVSGASTIADPDPADNNASTTTTSIAPVTADLSITKTTATTSAPTGSTFSYTIVLTNNGPDAATGVVMTDVLPAQLLFRSITQPAGFTCTTPAAGTNGTITCNAATLANGASATFTLVVEVAASSGTFSNTATASSAANDPNGGNSSGASAATTAIAAQADIELTKTTNATTATTGNTINYTITVTNTGPSPATNVIVTDTLPSGLAFLSATPSQGTCNNTNPLSCNLGTIANGGSATITLSAQVTATTGTITNSATVTSAEGDTDTSSSSPIPVTGAQQAAPIPTVSEWGLILLAAILAIAAALKMRQF